MEILRKKTNNSQTTSFSSCKNIKFFIVEVDSLLSGSNFGDIQCDHCGSNEKNSESKVNIHTRREANPVF